jgi:hypothetical protein
VNGNKHAQAVECVAGLRITTLASISADEIMARIIVVFILVVSVFIIPFLEKDFAVYRSGIFFIILGLGMNIARIKRNF